MKQLLLLQRNAQHTLVRGSLWLIDSLSRADFRRTDARSPRAYAGEGGIEL